MRNTKIQSLRDAYNNKSFTTKEANNFGISSRMLSFYVGKGELERVGRGLYVFPDFNIDRDFMYQDLALTAKSIKDSVICLVSALIYWELTEEFQGDFWLAIPNNRPIPKSIKNVRFIRPRDLKTGIITKNIADQEIKITTPERSVCEAFKYLDEETAITSLRMYMSQENNKQNIPKLLNTATALKSGKVIEIMNEIAQAMGKHYPSMDRESFKDFVSWFSKKKVDKKG
jgi:predicted transcriptional regulator of viral defense system